MQLEKANRISPLQCRVHSDMGGGYYYVGRFQLLLRPFHVQSAYRLGCVWFILCDRKMATESTRSLLPAQPKKIQASLKSRHNPVNGPIAGTPVIEV